MTNRDTTNYVNMQLILDDHFSECGSGSGSDEADRFKTEKERLSNIALPNISF